MNLIEQLHHTFCTYLTDTFGITPEQARACTFTLNVDEAKEAFGDISTNAAMLLAKQLKRNPSRNCQNYYYAIHPCAYRQT